MARKLVFYSFLTFVILPMSAILGVMCIIILWSAFGNPTAMIDVAILATFVLYSFSAFSFLTRGVQNGKPFKASFKDFIKVNGYVALIVSVLVVVTAVLYFTWPAFKNTAITELMKKQAAQPNGFDAVHLNAMLSKVLYGLGSYCILVSTHIIISLQLMRQYGNLFVKQAN